jgi:hypothetical protein
VPTVYYRTSFHPTIRPLACISKKASARTTPADFPTFESTLLLSIAYRLVQWAIARRVRSALNSMRLSVHTWRTMAPASTVTGAGWVMFIVPLECGKQPPPRPMGGRLRRILSRRDSAMLPERKLGLGELHRILTSSLNRPISFPSTLTSEHALFRGTVGVPSCTVPCSSNLTIPGSQEVSASSSAAFVYTVGCLFFLQSQILTA